MTITGFRHVALSVHDLDRSRAWYADAFGFEELFRESNEVRSASVMRIPGTTLICGLVQFAGAAHSGVKQMSTGPILNLVDPDGIALALSLAPTFDATQGAQR